MGVLASTWMKLDTLKTLVATLEAKNEKGIDLTISISDTTNEHGQNLTMYVSQSKEDREAGKSKFYAGNGKVFWTDGKIENATKKEASQNQSQSQPQPEGDGLPF